MKITKNLFVLLFILFNITFSKEKLEEIDLILDWYPNAIHGFIYTAIEKGYFKEEGIKVNIKFPSTPTDPIALTAAGKADIGIYYMPELIIKRSNMNIPVKSIGAIIKNPVSIIITPKIKTINSPKDLEGKTIGYEGSLYNEALVDTMMRYEGKSLKSAKLIDVGFELLTSMVTNQVDATIGGVINHEIPVMEEHGIDINYFIPTNYGVPNHYGIIFVAGDETIKKRKIVLLKFLKAAEKGMKEVKKDPYASIDLIIKNQQKENFPLNISVERKSIDILNPMIIFEEGSFFFQKDEIWKNNIEWLYSEKLIDQKLNSDEFYINLN